MLNAVPIAVDETIQSMLQQFYKFCTKKKLKYTNVSNRQIKIKNVSLSDELCLERVICYGLCISLYLFRQIIINLCELGSF